MEQFGQWPKAQEGFYHAINRVHSTNSKGIQLRNISTRSEPLMWEEQWVRCARQLDQWSVLDKVGRNLVHPELILESSWRLSDWKTLKSMFTKYTLTEAPHRKLYQIYIAITDKKLQDREMERLCEQGVQVSLREWQTLPSFISNAHTPLLQRFQRLVELQESAQMLQDINNYIRQGAKLHHDIKNFITTWRERLCNTWEDIPVWSDVLTWRIHMFNLMQDSFSAQPEMTHQFSRVHDTPWTVIKFAQVARKQQLASVSITNLAKLYNFVRMDATDAFNKLREHVKVCLQNSQEIKSALAIINSTGLDYFNVEQKAEMFRLKGEALQNLGYGDESNTSFSACLSISDSYGKGWLSWGLFCDRVFTLKKDLQWAEHSVVCYLQAISYQNNKVTHMFALDNISQS
jgi:transformation/transcription domain-associated protein